MFRARNVVVAVDFSETSDRAVEAALDLAARFDGRVTLVHAYEIPTLGFPDGVLVASSGIASKISTAATAALNGLAERFKGRAPIDTALRVGPPFQLVNEVADEVNADLLVIGTHGRRGLSRALLGSVAEKIIRTATRPVLVIHGEREA